MTKFRGQEFTTLTFEFLLRPPDPLTMRQSAATPAAVCPHSVDGVSKICNKEKETLTETEGVQ